MPTNTVKAKRSTKVKEITIIRARRGKETEVTGTVPELVEYFGYTLESGKSWEHEKGNKKINRTPKTAASLVANLNNASTNCARNGNSSTYYSLKG